MAKKGLGRGLDALLPEIEVSSDDRIQEIPLDKIVPNPYQPRKKFDPVKMMELAESIREHGVIQPVIVRITDGTYELVAGERRFRAARDAGLQTIPAVVRDIPDQRQMEIAMIENLQREDLNPIEEAFGLHTLITRLNITQEDLARRLSKSRPQIANSLRLLQLHPEIQDMLSEGAISAGHGKILAGIEDINLQLSIAKMISEQGMSVRETERYLSALRNETPSRKNAITEHGVSAQINYLQDELKVSLGAMVKILYRNGKGKIEIPYANDAELERITDTLLGKHPTGDIEPNKKFSI
jgi:ParB family chromosome partitioning protein